MEVHFATKKLFESLSQDKQRVRKYGAAVAGKLLVRLSQLASAPDLEELRSMPGGCHELREDRAGQLAIGLTKSLRLVFRPTEDPPPAKSDSGLDWAAVTAITILEVTDYHGD
jgi:plasmid maintenance system killer protein